MEISIRALREIGLRRGGHAKFAIETLADNYEALAAEAERLRGEAAAAELHRNLNRRCADALGLLGARPDPETGEVSLPSWHDMPERIATLRRGEAECIDDDGTPFAGARYWRAATTEACRRLQQARDALAQQEAIVADLAQELATVEMVLDDPDDAAVGEGEVAERVLAVVRERDAAAAERDAAMDALARVVRRCAIALGRDGDSAHDEREVVDAVVARLAERERNPNKRTNT